MTEPTEDQVRDMLLDAEIAVAAAGIIDWLPQWFKDLNDRHHAETQRLFEAGDLERAQVFADHGVSFDDGPACAKGNSTYPCRALRAVHDGTNVWRELTDQWTPGWEAEIDEWDDCGPCPEES